MEAHAPTAERTGSGAMSRRVSAPIDRRSDFAAVRFFVLSGLSLSVGAGLLLPVVFGADERGTIVDP
jgi:hypothetical protein